MEKGTSQFLRSAGRCGAMRRGLHAGMPLSTLPCLMPATLGQITSFSKKPSFFGKPAKAQAAPHGHAAKACSSQGLGSPPWACSSQGPKGMQLPRPWPHGHAVAKAPRAYEITFSRGKIKEVCKANLPRSNPHSSLQTRWKYWSFQGLLQSIEI